MIDRDKSDDPEYLRGAMHAFAFCITTGSRMSPAYAARQARDLLDMVQKGKQAPPLLWFLSELASGQNPDTVLDQWSNRMGRVI